MKPLITGYETDKYQIIQIQYEFVISPNVHILGTQRHSEDSKSLCLLREMNCLGLTSKWNLEGQGLKFQIDFLFTVYELKVSEH